MERFRATHKLTKSHPFQRFSSCRVLSGRDFQWVLGKAAISRQLSHLDSHRRNRPYCCRAERTAPSRFKPSNCQVATFLYGVVYSLRFVRVLARWKHIPVPRYMVKSLFVFYSPRWLRSHRQAMQDDLQNHRIFGGIPRDSGVGPAGS